MADEQPPPASASALPDEVVLLILRHLPEGGWADCAPVCRCWAALVRESRTALAVSLGAPAPMERLALALLAARRTRQPIVSVAIRCGGSGGRMPLSWSAVERRGLELLAAAAAPHLEALAVVGTAGMFPRLTQALDPVAAALAAASRLVLRELDLSWTDAIGRDALGDLLRAAEPSLRVLRLGGSTKVDDELLAERVWPLAPRLSELALPGCVSVSPLAVVALASRCASLVSLDLSQRPLNRGALEGIFTGHEALRANLRSISLAGHTGLPSESFAHVLNECERLEAIDFSQSLFDDDTISHVSSREKLKHLKSVRLSECSGLTDEGAATICTRAGGSLRTLHLGGAFSRMGAATTCAIGTCNSGLVELSMLSCSRLGGDALRIGLQSPACPQLESLDLSGCSNIDEGSLRAMLRRGGADFVPRLRCLALRSCAEAVTDGMLSDFLPRAKALERLDVSHCSALTDLSAVTLSGLLRRGAKALRHVDVSGCFRITQRGRKQLYALQAASRVDFVGLDDDEYEAEGGGWPRLPRQGGDALRLALEQLEAASEPAELPRLGELAIS